MTDGGLIPSQTYKDLVACEDNTAGFGAQIVCTTSATNCTDSIFLPDILLFTQAPILVWFDGTIIVH